MAGELTGPPRELIVLGVDPGLSATGYGLVLSRDGRHQALAFGAVVPPPRLSTPERLRALHDGLTAVIAEWAPAEVAVEDFVVGHARSAVAIGEARAMALLAAAQAGLPLALYKPAEVKRSVTSYGRGSKEQVAEMVSVLLDLDSPPQPADAADALAVALCHCLRRQPVIPDGASTGSQA
ncbi:MAG: crossover junction endodeoxyribonuclease RuvC [Dehalococcoidia bacterium]